MAETSPDKIVISAIGPLITTVIGAAIGWLPGGLTGAIGSPLTVLLAAVGGISGVVFSLMYKRYIVSLGLVGDGRGRQSGSRMMLSVGACAAAISLRASTPIG